jgi:opacity protein-like surface antigen
MEAIMNIFKSSILVSFVFVSNSFCQTISVGVGTGMNMIQGDNYYTRALGSIGVYHSVNGTEASFRGLAMRNGMDFAANAKYAFNTIPISFLAQVHFMPMRGHESILINNIVLRFDEVNDVTTKLDIWSFRFGARYAVDIAHIKPFISATFLINYFGDARLQFDKGDISITRPDYKNGMRYGYHLGLGASYRVLPKLDAEIEGSYSLLNNGNRRDGEVKLNTVNVLLNAYYTILE